MPHCDSRKSANSGQSESGVPIVLSPLKMETTLYGYGLAAMPTTIGWLVCKDY